MVSLDPVKILRRRVRNVFAVPLNQSDPFVPPVHAKLWQDEEFLRTALKKTFMFETLSDHELKPMIDAFECVSYDDSDTIVINQGDRGDYFYVILRGSCSFYVNDDLVGTATVGECFGELALLYTSPRAATVKTMQAGTTLYRVDQRTFRFILHSQMQQRTTEKVKLLRGLPFLKNLSDQDLSKLSAVMTPARFVKGEYLLQKGVPGGTGLYIIQEGCARVENISVAGDLTYEDCDLKPGDYCGDSSWVVEGNEQPCDVVASTNLFAFFIDRASFDKVVHGGYRDLMIRARDRTRLETIKVFKHSDLDNRTITALSTLLEDRSYSVGTKIAVNGVYMEAALFLIRGGKVKIEYERNAQRNTVLGLGGYFGEDLLLLDAERREQGQNPNVRSTFTVTVLEQCQCGVLTLANCRKVVDTRTLGSSVRRSRYFDSFAIRSISLGELQRHKILGAGTFGQVWLVSRVASDGVRVSYALKVQSKYELIQENQAHAVVNEKNVMYNLGHPFLLNMVAAYKDHDFVYMLLDLVPGGELYSRIYDRSGRGTALPEKHAQFYSACIAEGLGYMHRRGFVYRDLKPENVMINAKGYAVIIDFGFAKYVDQFKTFTLCGTPLYLPPEMILNRGHDCSADNWSLGAIIYELLVGKHPFDQYGRNQKQLFKAIVYGEYKIPKAVSIAAKNLICGLMTTNPTNRLGSLSDGEEGIVLVRHPWFASSIDFSKLVQQELNDKDLPPYLPKIENSLDTENFELWDDIHDKLQKRYPALSPEEEAIFQKF